MRLKAPSVFHITDLKANVIIMVELLT